MRKKQYIKSAAQKADSLKMMELILEVLLDVRDMIEKQNELIRRSQGGKRG